MATSRSLQSGTPVQGELSFAVASTQVLRLLLIGSADVICEASTSFQGVSEWVGLMDDWG